jgi:hypothetical protein
MENVPLHRPFYFLRISRVILGLATNVKAWSSFDSSPSATNVKAWSSFDSSPSATNVKAWSSFDSSPSDKH